MSSPGCALGLTPRQLRTMLRWEALGATGTGVATGLALGLLAASAVVSTLAQDLRLSVPALGITVIAAGGALASLVTAVPAIRSAGRITPAAAA